MSETVNGVKKDLGAAKTGFSGFMSRTRKKIGRAIAHPVDTVAGGAKIAVNGVAKYLNDGARERLEASDSESKAKKLQIMRDAIKDKGDASAAELRKAIEYRNANYTTNPTGKEYDKISAQAGKDSYQFSPTNGNRQSVQDDRDTLHVMLGNPPIVRKKK